MPRPLVVVLAVSALVVGATVWWLYPTPPKAAAGQSYKYLHCPQCLREQPYAASKAADRCVYCDKRFVPTAESVKTEAPKSPYVKMFMILYAELVGVMAAIWYVTRPKEKTDDEDFLHFRCPHCQQKLRYREAQVGNPGACPRCKKDFVFPAESAGDDEDAA